MKEYILLCTEKLNQLSLAQRQALNEEWEKIIAEWKRSMIFVDRMHFWPCGHTLFMENEQIITSPVTDSGVSSIIILLANNIDDMIETAKWCPALKYGGTINVIEPETGTHIPYSDAVKVMNQYV